MGPEPSPAWPSTGSRAVAALLFDRRIVMVSGELDGAAVSELASTLLTLDATGDEHVELRMSTCCGQVVDALGLMDVIDVLGVPVHGVAIGTIEGGPVGVLAVCARRSIAAHAQLVLREPDLTVSGTARDLERALASATAQREKFLRAIANRADRSILEIEQEWSHTSRLECDDAITLGYADERLRSGRSGSTDT